MRDKKWICLLLTFIMVLSLVACGKTKGAEEEVKEQENKPQKTLYEHGLDIIDLMVEAARDENYIYINSASKEIQEILQKIGNGDFQKPDKVFAVTGDMEVLESLIGLEDVEEMSNALQENLYNRMFSALINWLNGMTGAKSLAAASLCTMGKTFVDESLENNVMYVYVYENGTPVAVTFIPGEDGAVSAGGCFVMYELLFEETEELEEIWEGFGVEVEEVVMQ